MEATNVISRSQPHIGIMVCERSGTPPFADHSFYKSLAEAGRSAGLDVVVFCPLWVDFRTRTTKGYVYSVHEASWRARRCALPLTVYDRCFYDSYMQRRRYAENVRLLKQGSGCRVLGTELSGKLGVYLALREDARIAPFLPKTEPLPGLRRLIVRLREEGDLFLKPAGGSQGRGTVRIRKTGDESWEALGRDMRNAAFQHHFSSFKDLAAWIYRFTRRRRYLVQPHLDLTAADGKPFDVRALMQKAGDGNWSLTGMAVRRGQTGSVTSNLHGGGEALEAESFLASEFGEDQASRLIADIQRLSALIPSLLESRFGRLLELGLDFGVERSGRLWLLEANSKPGRTVFARIRDKTAIAKAVQRPIEYARYILRNNRNVRQNQ